MASGFVWGQTDCATFFGDCVEAVSGDDPLKEYRHYDSHIGAMRLLMREGHDSMLTFVEQRFVEIPIAHLRCGDLAFTGNTTRLTCPCIVLGENILGMAENGPVTLSRVFVVRGFRVP